MSETMDQEFDDLTRKIARERGFGCASYKEKCLRRRIAVRMRARGVHTYADYAHLLDVDDREYERLLDALTINVTKLFRNWEVYSAVAAQVVPALFALDTPVLRVWSAGCSSGEEPYSLAALLHAYAQEHDQLARLAHVDILGTDIDRASLAAAALGVFEESAFADTPAAWRARYFAPESPFTVAAELRSMVRFAQLDLLSEAPPAGPLHLILCRNVLIYFDRDTQEALFERFHAALAPGGFLVLGKVETLLGQSRARFTAIDGRERIFRRP